LCGVQGLVGFWKLVELERLEATVELELGGIGQLFAGMTQSDERTIRMVVAAAGYSEFCGGSNFSFARGSLMRIDSEDGFEAIHSLGIAMLREQDLAGAKIGRDGIGFHRQSVGEDLAGFIRLMKIKQSISEQNECRRVAGILLRVWAKQRSGFSRLVFRTQLLSTSNSRVGMSLGQSFQPGEYQRQEKAVKGPTIHVILL
jgi:hypothetical protein